MICSYIVAIDNSYPLISNFMEQLLTNIKKTDEVIIINDACENINTIQYLNKLSENSSQLKIVHLSKKVGFAKANNIGIAHSIGETLIFINSDIFLTNNCIENMLNLLWSNNKIGAVQPKLIYPQNNLIQSTGHIFSDYRSGQLFSSRKSDDAILCKDGKRQALTMALCAIKRNVVTKVGGFDEYYYNSHEGLELTLKISLNGYQCYYCSNAIAYHCSGGARSTALYDTSKQKAHFYQKWNKKIKCDLQEYLSFQLLPQHMSYHYFVLNFSTSHYWEDTLNILKIKRLQHEIFQERFLKNINLFYCLPYSSLNYKGQFLFLCDNISQIKSNYRWIFLRKDYHDIIMDLDGNLVSLQYFIQ